MGKKDLAAYLIKLSTDASCSHAIAKIRKVPLQRRPVGG